MAVADGAWLVEAEGVASGFAPVDRAGSCFATGQKLMVSEGDNPVRKGGQGLVATGRDGTGPGPF